MTITITHSHAEGTLVDGTAKGDGSSDILKAAGFRWFPSLGMWGVPKSRDREAQRWRIDQAERGLKAAGFQVEVTVDDTPRDYDAVAADRHERLEQRRAALAVKAEHADATSQALHAASGAAIDGIPLGQPALPGRRGNALRNARERSVDLAIRGAGQYFEARRLERQVQASRGAEAYRENPVVIARRIDRIETELRKLDRELAGIADDDQRPAYAQARSRRELLLVQVKADRDALAAARERHGLRAYGPKDICVGDRVRIKGSWRLVVRANRTTVSVDTGYSWVDKYPYYEITDMR